MIFKLSFNFFCVKQKTKENNFLNKFLPSIQFEHIPKLQGTVRAYYSKVHYFDQKTKLHEITSFLNR